MDSTASREEILAHGQIIAMATTECGLCKTTRSFRTMHLALGQTPKETEPMTNSRLMLRGYTADILLDSRDGEIFHWIVQQIDPYCCVLGPRTHIWGDPKPSPRLPGTSTHARSIKISLPVQDQIRRATSSQSGYGLIAGDVDGCLT